MPHAGAVMIPIMILLKIMIFVVMMMILTMRSAMSALPSSNGCKSTTRRQQQVMTPLPLHNHSCTTVNIVSAFTIMIITTLPSCHSPSPPHCNFNFRRQTRKQACRSQPCSSVSTPPAPSPASKALPSTPQPQRSGRIIAWKEARGLPTH